MSLRSPQCSQVRPIAIVLGLLALAAFGPAQLVAPASAQEDMPPQITSVSVLPNSLPYTGGMITITVGATDDIGIASIGVTVYDPNFAQTGVSLTANGDGTYSGQMTVPGNFNDEPANYTMEVGVTDTGGNFVSELTGGFTVDGQPQFDEAPAVFDPALSPTALPSSGGVVTIATSATDLGGIASAYAEITQPGGTLSFIDLVPISESRFEGTFSAPANTTTTQSYTVRVGAQDSIGQEVWAAAGSFTVAGRVVASPGTVSLTPSKLAFGMNRRGGVKRKSVVLKHTGKKGTAPVEGTLATTGAGAFRLQGAGSTGLPFKLAPGQSRTIVVEFAPPAAGTFAGTLVVTRLDGRQAGLASRLTGKAK